MNFLTADAHSAVLCADTVRLAEILWHLLKAEQLMSEKCHIRTKEGMFEQSESTEFGEEVGRDEIHWWVFKKESDLNTLRDRTQSTLAAADRLKTASTKLKTRRPSSYDALLQALREFVTVHSDDIQTIHDYLTWLRSRHELAPSILFTYRVWGSTRRGDRWLVVKGDAPTDESRETVRALTELTLGLRTGGLKLYAYDRAMLDIAGEIYESDPKNSGNIDIPEGEVLARASWQILDEFSIFFEWIRNSLRNVQLDIDKCVAQRRLMHSEAFWRRFLEATVGSANQETQLWDFKETITAWHAKGNARNDAKITFAEDVASFANAEGGVLIVGVTDKREVVGIGAVDQVEDRLKFARDILVRHLDYPRDIVSFHQLMVKNRLEAAVPCLIIAIANAMEAVGVSNGAGQFTYPVRRETGISRESIRDINMAKGDAKSDEYDFMEKLEQFTRDNGR